MENKFSKKNIYWIMRTNTVKTAILIAVALAQAGRDPELPK